MNEIVASFLLIYLTEASYVNSFANSSSDSVTPRSLQLASEFLRLDCVEADVFSLFSRMMEIGHLEMFRPNLSENNKKKAEYNVNSKK